MSDSQKVFAAVPHQEGPQAIFTVTELEGERPHTKHIFDKKEGVIKQKTINEPAGYLVKFPKGHSIRCRDKAHLARIGADASLIPVIDNDGEQVATVPNSVSSNSSN